MKQKFRRAGMESSRYGMDDNDAEGRVRVYVRLISPDDSSVVRGNMTKTFTIDAAQVSAVADAIEAALF